MIAALLIATLTAIPAMAEETKEPMNECIGLGEVMEPMEAPIPEPDGDDTEKTEKVEEIRNEPEIKENIEAPAEVTPTDEKTEPEPDEPVPEPEQLGEDEDRQEAVRDKIRENVQVDMEPIEVTAEPEGTDEPEEPQPDPEQTVSEEEVWFDEGEQRLKELEKEGWERLLNRNGVMKTEDGKTTYVTNAPIGYRQVISDEVVTSRRFTDRDDAYRWILENGLTDTDIQIQYLVNGNGIIYHGFTDFEEAEKARQVALDKYYLANQNNQEYDKGFLGGAAGYVSDRVYKQDLSDWSEIDCRALIGELRSLNRDGNIEEAIRNKLAEFYNINADNIEFEFTRKADLLGMPAEVTVRIQEPCTLTCMDGENGGANVEHTSNDVRYTFKTQIIDGTDDVRILPVSGAMRFTEEAKETQPQQENTPKKAREEEKTIFQKIGDGLSSLWKRLTGQKETPEAPVVPEPELANPCVTYGYYEIVKLPVYQASGRRVIYGQRSNLTVTEKKTEEPQPKEATPLELLKMSYALTWETDDGLYTCHGIRLDNGVRATEYYSNETGELIAVVPMK